MTEIFRQTLINLTADRVLDRRELTDLRKAAESTQKEAPGSADAQIAEQTLRFLESHKSENSLRMELPEGSARRNLEFLFTPAYAETDLVPGSTAREQVAYLSQSDSLSETTHDGNRCGAATLLSAHLLMGGSFNEAAQRLGLPSDQRSFTYGNAHRAQEKLYQVANSDSNPALNAAYSYGVERGTGKIVSAVSDGEIAVGAAALKMGIQPLLGSHQSTLNQRREQVDSFWREHPQGVLQVGVNLNTQTGVLSPPDANSGSAQNHFVVVYRHQGQYVMLDSGQRSNGTTAAAKPLSAAEYSRFVNTSTGTVNGLWRQ